VARLTDPVSDDGVDPDEEALSWAGDEAQGRMRPRLAAGAAADPDAGESSLEAAPDDDPAEEEADARAPSDVPGTALAVVFGIVYLALTVGWIYSVQLLSSPSADLGPEVVWQFGEFVAMIAAPVWFAAVIALTRGRLVHRLGWFALGAGVLLPWPVVVVLAG